MREILFRGKCKSTGEWVYGQYVLVNPVDMPKKYRKPKAVIFPTNADCNWFNKYFYSSREVIPETVGQYTGVIDANGNQIFEGDVIDIPHWCVTYLTGREYGMNAGWYIQRDNFESWIELECSDRHKVIGNIYDNPELLEG